MKKETKQLFGLAFMNEDIESFIFSALDNKLDRYRYGDICHELTTRERHDLEALI